MKVGLILGRVYHRPGLTPAECLRDIAAIGYRNGECFAFVEDTNEVTTFGLRLEAKEAKQVFSDAGMNVVGSHFYPLTLVEKNFEKYCEYFAETGCRQIGCGGRESMENMDEILRKCETMNKAGEIAKQFGLRFYYHNHYHEFRKRDGKYIWHHIQDNTEKGLVFFEIDTYWVARGGADPVSEIKRLKDRLILIHQKDFSKDAEEPLCIFDSLVDPDQPIPEEMFQSKRHAGTYTEVGTGILPIQAYIDAANDAGSEYIILEQDFVSMDMMESIKISMDSFRKYNGLDLEN